MKGKGGGGEERGEAGLFLSYKIVFSHSSSNEKLKLANPLNALYTHTHTPHILEFEIARMSMSVAPISESLSIFVAASFFSMRADTAHIPSSSRFVTVGEVLPGVTVQAVGRREREML